MSGIFGVVSKGNCLNDLFYGTDYHSHLGTETGGLVVLNGQGTHSAIRDLRRHQFRAQLTEFKNNIQGKVGIGVISDYEPQPLILNSRLGEFAIGHVGKINNLDLLVSEEKEKGVHFINTTKNQINPVEVIGAIINKGRNYQDGLEIMQNTIQGSSSTMLLTSDGIYLARDRLGRTPIVIGKKEGSTAAALESCSFPNLGFKIDRFLGPGEIGILTSNGYQQLKKPEDESQICSFLWVYFGYPSSNYEGINVESMRNRSGAILARRDREQNLQIDLIAGIPDSGTGHAIGYSDESNIPLKRPFVKYTPTWPRSFMPSNQTERELIAEMKLIPIQEMIEGKKILFVEDSIVRGTQLKGTIERVYNLGAKEVHMRPACPPISYVCPYLNFSSTKSSSLLATRRAMKKLTGNEEDETMQKYTLENTEEHLRMVDSIRQELGLTTLRYQTLQEMVSAIGLSNKSCNNKCPVCTYCWTGK